MNATDTIVLHSKDLSIDSKGVVIEHSDGSHVPIDSVSFVPEKELMYVKAAEKLIKDTDYVLIIPFNGNITDDLAGYYKSSYVDKETNKTRFVIVIIKVHFYLI